MVYSPLLDQAGVEVNVFTRANKPNQPESVEVADCATIKDL